jgi:hypothetical protein
MPSDWAANAAQRVRDHQKATELENAALLEQRNLLIEQAPGLWQQLFTLNAEFKDGSSSIEYTNVSTTEFRARLVTWHFKNELIAEFTSGSSQSALKWCYTAGKGGGGGCSLVVTPTGKVSFYYGMVEIDPDALAEKILNGLLEE